MKCKVTMMMMACSVDSGYFEENWPGTSTRVATKHHNHSHNPAFEEGPAELAHAWRPAAESEADFKCPASCSLLSCLLLVSVSGLLGLGGGGLFQTQPSNGAHIRVSQMRDGQYGALRVSVASDIKQMPDECSGIRLWPLICPPVQSEQ